ncbi:MAG: universal stress protein, partial [Methanococcaceae archaeon]
KLQLLFQAELVLIHVGDKSKEEQIKIETLTAPFSFDPVNTKLITETGDPASAIIKVCMSENIDLLIAGALEKESIFQYYIGSVARKILRKAHCSVLLLISREGRLDKMEKFCVAMDFTTESEEIVKKAYNFARLEQAKQLILIREYEAPGLVMSIQDTGSTVETERTLLKWKTEEEQMMSIFVKELNLKDIPVKTICLYGKIGWEANKYVNDIHGDILVIAAPKQKLKFFDRIFQHDMEYILKKLPCALLVVK